MAAFDGIIETISGRVISGRIIITPPPPGPVTIQVLDAGKTLGAVIANAEDGICPFEYLLPATLFDGAAHEFTARIGNAEIALRNNTHLLGPSSPAAVRKSKGWLEMVSDNGVVKGWAWYPDHPADRVELEILVDGKIAGTVLAAQPRQDVLDAGFGDGKYGFSWPLPFALLVQPHTMTIMARDKQSGHALGEALTFRQTFANDAIRRISEMEADIRLLNASLCKLGAARARDQDEAALLFKTVGEFFNTLAESGPAPRELRLLKPAITEITTGFTPFAFRQSLAPALTIFVEVGGPVADLYAMLHSLAGPLLAHDAEIFLLDGDPLAPPCDEAALLPLIIQNLRYLRLPAGAAAARYNRAMHLAAGALAMFVGPGVKPDPACIDTLASLLPTVSIAALAGKITGPDGYLRSAGIERRGMAASLRGAASPADAPGFAAPALVDAVTPELFALRTESWSRRGGLDEAYATSAPALAAFCLALRASGLAVQYHPGFAALAPAAPDFTDIATQRADDARLREATAALFTPDDIPQPAG